MAVMMIAEVPNQTQAGYDGLLAALEGALRAAPGFLMHSAYPTADGWRAIEIWETSKHCNDFFARHVHPILPPGIKPQRSVHELHSLVKV